MVRSIIINDDIAHHYFISRDDEGTYSLPIATHPAKNPPPQNESTGLRVNKSTSLGGRTSLWGV
ncbi:MAG: hypothetical protein L6U16_09145 [Porphyromonadaceae bacterium]|nr:MAG: hypothetical protein L6U16_09145 [Porphyromonadaceae bacterium]